MSYKRGIVREVDGKTGRARVEFQGEDGVVSYWLHVNQALASGKASRCFVMPEQDSYVNCLLDEHGEEGTILGATYNEQDAPPVSDPNHIHMDLGGGLKLNYDKGAGRLTLAVPNGITLAAGGSEYVIGPEGITLTAGSFTVNAPTAFTKGFTVSGGDGATATVNGDINVSRTVSAGQTVTAGQDISAPILRGTVVP